MGSFQYDSQVFPVDDRTLFHLQTVIAVKLRRKEPFLLSWITEVSAGSGRHAVWIDNGVPLHFEYSGGRAPRINRTWIELLITAANSSAGLNLTDTRTREPTE